MKLDKNAARIIELLEKSGFSAYAVGGCVRDAFLGRETSDTDIATAARPEQTEAVLRDNGIRFFETGIKHGTVSALVNEKTYEITTFRADGVYTDNRRPDSVRYIEEIEPDLSRRDFTVNAMAYNERTGVIDLFGGRDDINNRIIRTVGDPMERFREDALRVLRAMRFASVLDFEVEEQTARAVLKCAPLLAHIACERITSEFVKMLCGDGASRIILQFRPVIEFIFPRTAGIYSRKAWDSTASALARLPHDTLLRLGFFICSAAGTVNTATCVFYNPTLPRVRIVNDLLSAMRLPAVYSKRIREVSEHLNCTITPDRRVIGHLIADYGYAVMSDIIEIRRAVFASSDNNSVADEMTECKRILDDIISNGDPVSVSSLVIDGSDVLSAGYVGAEVGEMLNRMLLLVIDGELKNERAELLSFLVDN